MRRIYDYRLGPGVERLLQLAPVERKVGISQRDVTRGRAGQDRVGSVILVNRLEDDDLVARVDHREQARDHRFGRAACHRDIALGVAFESVIRARLFSDRLAEIRRAVLIAYWLYSSSIARLAASLIAAGAGKSGNPCARLTAPVLSARRVISRMTDSVKNLVLVDTSTGMARTVNAGKRTPANCTCMAGILEKNGRRVGKEAGFYSTHAASEARPVNSFVLGNIETDLYFLGGRLPSTQPTTPDARAIRATASPLMDGLMPHVTLAQFFHLLRTLLQPPLIDSLDIEAPVAAHLEPGQLSLLQQAVNGGTMHAALFRELAYGKNLCITQHLTLLLSSI